MSDALVPSSRGPQPTPSPHPIAPPAAAEPGALASLEAELRRELAEARANLRLAVGALRDVERVSSGTRAVLAELELRL